MNLSTVVHGLRPGLEAFLNFLYPPVCVICKSCPDAGQKLVCQNCWSNLPLDRPVAHDPATRGELQEIRSVWQFSEEVQTVIHELKYHNKKSLSKRFGCEMAVLLLRTPAYAEADLLMPVPLHRTRFRERGFNQSLLLCQAISSHTGMPVESQVLRRTKHTGPQAKLSATERERNVATAFQVVDAGALKCKSIIVVDDVLTTGATLRACAAALRRAGATRIFGLTAARTP